MSSININMKASISTYATWMGESDKDYYVQVVPGLQTRSVTTGRT